MTHYQYGTLKAIINNPPTLQDLQEYNMTTIRSLLIRSLIERRGQVLEATQLGRETYNEYRLSGANLRKQVAPLSDSVKHLLHLHKLYELKRRA